MYRPRCGCASGRPAEAVSRIDDLVEDTSDTEDTDDTEDTEDTKDTKDTKDTEDVTGTAS
ncbi:hypothetical protein [Streptomyces sp. NPDC086519]|uniref:hypothetical protein n=1 Tax=Streptomyces sp. NPDC086519 TaxID=3154863 RepID=UPI003439E7D8